MSAEHLVIGHFRNIDDTQSAIVSLREKGHEDIELYSPFPNHDLEDEMYRFRKRSPVRRCTLAGGLTGCLGAFLFTSWMSIDWPIRVSAKPLVSFPAFVIIAFECTILLGSIVNLLSMFHFSRIPAIFKPKGFRPNFTEGTFGLVVRVPKESAETVKAHLTSGGAYEVEDQYVR